MDALNAPQPNHSCGSVDELQTRLQNLVTNAKPCPSRADHISVTLELLSHITFHVNVSEDENDALENVPPLDPQLGGTSADKSPAPVGSQAARQIKAIDTLINQPPNNPVTQRSVARHLMGLVGEVDGSKWIVGQVSRDVHGWTFSYLCKDSLQNWSRQKAKNSPRTLIGEWSNKDGQDPVNMSRPAYDCRGIVTVSFLKNTKSVNVKYEHTCFHATVAELADLLVPPDAPPAAGEPAVVGTPKASKGQRKRRRNSGEDGQDGAIEASQPKKKRQKRNGNAEHQTTESVMANGTVLQLPPGEAETRRQNARTLIAEAGIDPDTLSDEQMDIFANQTPDLQTESLEMLAKYGAERLRIVHPQVETASSQTSAELTADGSEAPKPRKLGRPRKNPPAGVVAQAPVSPTVNAPTSTQKRTRTTGSCLACKHGKVKCWKERPSCSRCVKRGRQCIYPQPKEEARKSRSSTVGAVSELEQPTEEATMESASERAVEQSIEVTAAESATEPALQESIEVTPVESAVDSAVESAVESTLQSATADSVESPTVPTAAPEPADEEPDELPPPWTTQDVPTESTPAARLEAPASDLVAPILHPATTFKQTSTIYQHESGLTFPVTHLDSPEQVSSNHIDACSYDNLSNEASRAHGASEPATAAPVAPQASTTQSPPVTFDGPSSASTVAALQTPRTSPRQGRAKSRRSFASGQPAEAVDADTPAANTGIQAGSGRNVEKPRPYTSNLHLNESASTRSSPNKTSISAGGASHKTPDAIPTYGQGKSYEKTSQEGAFGSPQSGTNNAVAAQAALQVARAHSRQGRAQTRTSVTATPAAQPPSTSYTRSSAEQFTSYSPPAAWAPAPSKNNDSTRIAYEPYADQPPAPNSSRLPLYSYNSQSLQSPQPIRSWNARSSAASKPVAQAGSSSYSSPISPVTAPVRAENPPSAYATAGMSSTNNSLHGSMLHRQQTSSHPIESTPTPYSQQGHQAPQAQQLRQSYSGLSSSSQNGSWYDFTSVRNDSSRYGNNTSSSGVDGYSTSESRAHASASYNQLQQPGMSLSGHGYGFLDDGEQELYNLIHNNTNTSNHAG